MRNLVKLDIENIGKEIEFPAGLSLSEILSKLNIESKYPFVGAMVDNELEEMSYNVFKPKRIKFITIQHKDGARMYIRSLNFILMKAVKDLYPNSYVKIEHAISNGYFCEVAGNGVEMSLQTVSDIENQMRKIIDADYPFEREDIRNKDAIKIFEENNYNEKANLFKQSPALYTSIYKLNGLYDYFYGYLVPSTGYIKNFDLLKLYDGMLLRVPERKNPDELRKIVEQKKMFEVLEEHKDWVNILKASNIGRVNEQVVNGKAGELIKIAEALQEKKISQIAEKIKSEENKKLVLVSGPSSSGKTTFSKRLAIQLRVAGLTPFIISFDNYFVNREDTPLDENGDYNFEDIEALDIDLFNNNINELKAGKAVKLPTFDFEKGRKFYTGEETKISSDTVIIAEGIHALNPKLTKNIDDTIKYKVYVSALTQINIDTHNRIPTTDNRLIRRLVRDYNFRHYSALDTLSRWDSVRNGEKKNIFPFQENCDVMFNSALLYELGVLKKHAEPLLREIWQTEPEYAEAQRLLKLLSYVKHIPEKEIPPTSIMREFLGDSSFHY